jgi:DNA-binding NarL/FixJ family response regulator
MSQPIILLIDDHAMFRAGLRMIIEADMPGLEVFEAGSIQEVMHGSANVPAVAFTPSMVLLDLNLPDNATLSATHGLVGIGLLKKKWPHAPVLVLSSQDDQDTIQSALNHDATGFVSKAESAKIIVEAIQRILTQHTAQPCAAAMLSEQLLSQRKSEVLQLLSQGLSNKLIARKLQISENTVRIHVQALLKFFHASNRSEVAFSARQQNLVT